MQPKTNKKNIQGWFEDNKSKGHAHLWCFVQFNPNFPFVYQHEECRYSDGEVPFWLITIMFSYYVKRK